MLKIGLIFLILTSFISCVFYPKYSHEEDDIQSGFITRKLEVDFVSPDGDQVEGLVDLIDVMSDIGDEPEIALVAGLVVLSIPVGSAIISGSIVISNNTIYWLEGQVREDDSSTRRFLKKYKKNLKKSGAIFINTTDDLLKWLKLKKDKKK